MAQRSSTSVSQVIAKPSIQTLNYVLYTVLLFATFALGFLVSRVLYFDGGLSAFVLGENTTKETRETSTTEVEPGELPVLGKNNADVTIIEFPDLQCPFCRRFFEDAYPQIKKEYIDTGKVKLYFRHYPLAFHPMAVPSALAAECAADQNKFWEFHDKAYQEQAKQGQGTIEYTNDDLKKWASQIKLDMDDFNKCFDSQKHKQRVDRDFADGSAAGVSGTPTFYINGNQLVGAQPFTAFKTIIDQELKK